VEATEQILVRAGPDVVKTGFTVRGGRTLVEDPRFSAFAVSHGALEYVMLAPAVELSNLKGHEVDLGAYWAKHAYSSW
jgi:hypothetical protein